MTSLRLAGLAALALAVPVGCSSSSSGGGATTATTGTTTGQGGTSQGGAGQGGSSQGGSAQGGAAQGGAGQGGANVGGAGPGGASQGGAGQGGANVGGAPPGCDAPATFGEVQAKALSSCGAIGGLMSCHSKPEFGGGLDLTKDVYAQLVNAPAVGAPGKLRVKPGDATGSFLYQKLTNTMAQDDSEGKPMPQGEGIQWQPPKPDVEAAVRCWILGGAKND